MDLNEIYTQLIMEHSSSKHNRRSLENPNLCEKGHNPSCGDEITLEIKVNGDTIEDLARVWLDMWTVYTPEGMVLEEDVVDEEVIEDVIDGMDSEKDGNENEIEEQEDVIEQSV